MHIILALTDHLNENKSLIKQHAYIALKTYWQNLDKHVKIILCGGKTYNNKTNATRMADIIKNPDKYDTDLKAIPECDLSLQEKSTTIYTNTLLALDAVAQQIDCSEIRKICLITSDFHFSITVKNN